MMSAKRFCADVWETRLLQRDTAAEPQRCGKQAERRANPHLLLLWYRSAEPARRVAKAGLQPGSPLMKRRTSSRKRPFHSPHTSQLGKEPTWYSPPQSDGSA